LASVLQISFSSFILLGLIHLEEKAEMNMGKDTYLVLEIENRGETSPVRDWECGYEPARWEEVKIEFTMPPYGNSRERRHTAPEKKNKTFPEVDRRKGSERRKGTDRRMGSKDRRSWQESRWIGAPDCRSGQSDRRQDGDRRVNPDRRRK
jgi:hypothetical protein